MVGPITFQAVLLVGSSSKELFPLVSEGLVHPLLPVGNRALLSYSLQAITNTSIGSVLIVISGDSTTAQVKDWLDASFEDFPSIEIVTVPEESGSAESLRMVASRLKAPNVLVLSSDVITDMPLGSLAAAHRRHNATVTALLYHPSGSLSAAESSKEKIKKSSGAHQVFGIDSSGSGLLYMSPGLGSKQNVSIRRSLIRSAGQLTLYTDLLDAQIYAFKTDALLQALHSSPDILTIHHDLLPYFVRQQQQVQNPGFPPPSDLPSPSSAQDPPPAPSIAPPSCHVLLAPPSVYCNRLTSLQNYAVINHDIVAEALPLTGYQLSSHNNVVHPSAQLGNKSTIGPQCIVGEDVTLADKCSVKRSVIGSHCRIASGVKITNSLLMDDMVVGEGCVVQNSILGHGVVLQDHVTLKDCHVGSGYVLGSGQEHRGELLAKKE